MYVGNIHLYQQLLLTLKLQFFSDIPTLIQRVNSKETSTHVRLENYCS